jgi:cysteinyl-tRNA synthetase
VPSDPSYGVLSRRSRDEQVAGARVEVAPYKKDPADFVPWKPSSDDQPGWDSPYGRGRPGWHIECSAMAARHLGLPFDIHAGGADLKFPHHENEIAQSCCAQGQADQPESFAKYWLHNGFLTVDGEKMSKSLGNFKLAHDLLEQVEGPVLRLCLLSAHYRQPLDWSETLIHENEKRLAKIRRKLKALETFDADQTAMPDADILNALCDDLNTPKAFAALEKLLKAPDNGETKKALLASLPLFGLDPARLLDQTVQTTISEEEIQALIEVRADAKKQKDFARADEIRAELLSQGIAIEDTRDGTKWNIL